MHERQKRRKFHMKIRTDTSKMTLLKSEMQILIYRSNQGQWLSGTIWSLLPMRTKKGLQKLIPSYCIQLFVWKLNYHTCMHPDSVISMTKLRQSLTNCGKSVKVKDNINFTLNSLTYIWVQIFTNELAKSARFSAILLHIIHEDSFAET